MHCRWQISLLFVIFIQHTKEIGASVSYLDINIDFRVYDFDFDENITKLFLEVRQEIEDEGRSPETSANMDPKRTTPATYIDIDDSMFWDTSMLTTHTASRTTPVTYIDIDESWFSSGEDYTEERKDPCNYDKFEHIPPPSLHGAGKRVSEMKCQQYSWDFWANVIESKRNEALCLKKLGKTASTIVGGYTAREGDFPHMGAVGWKLPPSEEIIFLCGSSLISPKFVLTAAHCRQVNDTDPYLVRFGSVYIGNDDEKKTLKEDILIKKFLMLKEYEEHPNWKYNDIALIELEEELELKIYIRPACLWTGDIDYNLVANISGWGIIAEYGTKSDYLKYAEVNFINKQTCKKYLNKHTNRNWKQGLKDHQFCAGKLQGGVDSCQGDSGGPLQIRQPMPMRLPGEAHYIVGVTSFGIKCAYNQLPGVYIKVSSFLCWIEKIVWPEEYNSHCP